MKHGQCLKADSEDEDHSSFLVLEAAREARWAEGQKREDEGIRGQ